MLASDVTAVIQYTREVCYLEDGEVAVLTADGVQVYNSLLQPVEKEHLPCRLGDLCRGKGGL